MAPITKENEAVTSAPKAPSSASATSGFRPDETASRPQPVALELPVTVNGARTVEGSDKREPFSETTKTVLVFGNGAVLRLTSPVAPGQLLFLTNEKTKKEVVCQVVKSKNYRSVSGYVELEFTESVVGFWGMRFPTDRIAAQAPTVAPVTPLAPAVPKVPATPVTAAQTPAKVAPVAPITPPLSSKVTPITSAPTAQASSKPVAPSAEFSAPAESPLPKWLEPSAHKTETPAKSNEEASFLPVAPVAPVVPMPKEPADAASSSAELIMKQPEAPAPLSSPLAEKLASSVASLLSPAEAPKAAPPAIAVPEAPAQPVVSATNHAAASFFTESSSQKLQLETERLARQLSSFAFAEEPEEKSAAAPNDSKEAAPSESKKVAQLASEVVDLAKSETAPVKPAAPAAKVPPPVTSSLDSEELKIPSWLEPLARNAAAPASTQELIEREKAKHAVEMEARAEAREEQEPTVAAAAEPVSKPEVELPGIGSLLPFDAEALQQEQRSASSKLGLFIAVAAAVVLTAAGAWYFLRPTDGAQGTPAPITRTVSTEKSSAPAASSPVRPETQAAPQNPVVLPEEPPKPNVSAPASSAPVSKSVETPQPVQVTRDNSRTQPAAIPAAATERIPKPAPVTSSAVVSSPAPAQPEPKKQSIGEVHLASPTVNRPTTGENDSDAPSISSGDSDSSAAGLGSGLATDSSKQPAAPEAPLPVGGDVKSAKLISSVLPMYPSMARNQHVSGNVSVDALIDINGKVTTMKVVSGPALLRQAAMDALRQWKYQPATLDGKPVPMHLTVTLQFRPE